MIILHDRLEYYRPYRKIRPMAFSNASFTTIQGFLMIHTISLFSAKAHGAMIFSCGDICQKPFRKNSEQPVVCRPQFMSSI